MKIAKRYDNGKLTIFLYGELDHHAARSTMCAITELVEIYLPRQVVLDFGGLGFMDSSGIALILKLNRLMEISGGDIWIEHPNRQVLRVLEASGIGKLVPITTEVRGE